MKQRQDIPQLLYKAILGRLTAEEKSELDAYRQESEQHEALYQRLMSSQYLQAEYIKRELINIERPRLDMKRRIDAKRRHIWWRRAASAAAAFAIGFGCYYIGTQSIDYSRLPDRNEVVQQQQPQLIVPGETKAQLTLADGKTVQLDAHTRPEALQAIKAMPGKDKKTPPTSATALNKLCTPKGGEFKIILEDSTEVWLNSESQLHYPERFGEAERRVKLIGEAYFKVKKDANRPFFVESGKQTIRVYGTEFNVDYYEENNAIYTTLVNGKIAIMKTDEKQGEIVLSPGHQAVFDKQQTTTTIRKVNTKAVASWKDGMFVFEEQSLKQIMYKLGRWYDFTFEFADEQASQIVFMGSIPRNSGFDDALSIIEKSGGLKFETVGKHLIISSL